MNVLVFTSLYPNHTAPNHGVFIKERMTRFATLEGCQIRVISPVPYFPPLRINWRWRFSQIQEHEVRDGIEVYHPRYYMIPKVGMSLSGVLMFLSVLSTVKRVQRNFDFDLIDAHFIYPDGLAGVLLGRFLRKPVVVSARGSDINLYMKFPVIRQLLKYTLTSADRVIAVSQALKDSMATLGIAGEKIIVVPNGVDSEKMRPIPRREARRALGLPAEKKILLAVGNLTANKGFEVVIQALKILREEFHEKDLYLIIVGEGQQRTVIEQMIASLHLHEEVLLVGAKPHEELALWYSAADLFCLASLREGWPNVLLEAMSCGTPVVATPVGGIPEIIRSNKVGLLAPRETAKYADTLHMALNQTWRADDLIEYARKHSWECTAGHVRRVFESVLGVN